MAIDGLTALAVVCGLLLSWGLIGLRVFTAYNFYDRLLAGVVGGLVPTISLRLG